MRGFTLVEVMIGSTIAVFVLAGVLSSFVMLGRSGALIYNYNGMSVEARRALEEFGQDVRMASAIVWNGTASVTLTVPDNYVSNGNLVTYAYNSATSGATARAFYRRPGNAASTAAATVLVRNVVSGSFYRFDRLDASATTDAATKRLEFALRMRTGGLGSVAATENAVSASFLLRNKATN